MTGIHYERGDAPEAAAAGLGVGFWRWDIRAEEIRWSDGMVAIFGLPAAPDRPLSFEDVLRRVHPEDRAGVAAVVGRTLAERRPRHEQRFRILRPDGTVRLLLSRARLETDAAGEPAVLACVDVDLGELPDGVASPPRPDAMRELEELEAIYRAVPLGLGLFDREHRFVRLNGALAEINGLPVERQLGRLAWDVLPGLREALEPLFRCVFETGEPVVGIEISGETPRAPGVRRDWLELLYPVTDAAGTVTHVGVVVEEVTARRAAEAALREREARFSAVFAAIDEGFCLCEMILDGDGRPADYRFLELNPLFEEMTGLAGAAGRTALEMVPDLERAWIEVYARAALDRERLRFEMGSVAMGRVFDVFTAPAEPHGRFVIVFKDVTARRTAEAALRESEERLASALEAGGVGTFDWDLATGRLAWDETTRRLWGVAPDEAVTIDTFWSGVHPADRAAAVAAIEAAKDPAGEGRFHAEYRIIDRSSGKVRWVEAGGRMRFAERVPVRLLGTVLDVTERREAVELQQLLVREVNHRSKNMLAVVQSIVRMTPKTDVRSFVATVLGRIQAIANAHDLLSEREWEPVSLDRLVERELAAYTQPCVRVDGPDAWLAPEAAQPVALALHELATNAAKYGALSTDARTLTVRWRPAAAGLVLQWCEDGASGLQAPARTSFGMRLIQSVIEQQIAGSVAFDWRPTGLRCEIAIPASCLR